MSYLQNTVSVIIHAIRSVQTQLQSTVPVVRLPLDYVMYGGALALLHFLSLVSAVLSALEIPGELERASAGNHALRYVLGLIEVT